MPTYEIERASPDKSIMELIKIILRHNGRILDINNSLLKILSTPIYSIDHRRINLEELKNESNPSI